MKTVLRVLPCILWMCLIFWFSAQPAEQSAKQSHAVTSEATKIYETAFGVTTAEVQHADGETGLNFYVRKVAHLFLYTVLACLALLATRKWHWAAALSALYAVTDEVHQLFVSGRSGSAVDVLIDCAGIALGLAMSIALLKIRKREK